MTQHIAEGYTGLFEKDWYITILIRTLQAAIENVNQLLNNLSGLLWKNLGSFMRVSTALGNISKKHAFNLAAR